MAAIVKNAAYDDHMVENLLLLKGHCDAVVKNAFVDEVPISRATPSRPSGSQAADDGERVEWAMASVLRGVRQEWARSLYQVRAMLIITIFSDCFIDPCIIHSST